MRSQSRACTLADADVDRPPRPHARCNVHPDKGRTVVPAVQKYPLAVPEPTEAEASAVFEEVAPLDAAMPVGWSARQRWQQSAVAGRLGVCFGTIGRR